MTETHKSSLTAGTAMAPERAAVVPGSEAHKILCCRVLLGSFDPDRPNGLRGLPRWPHSAVSPGNRKS